jgi:hypothetical protein
MQTRPVYLVIDTFARKGPSVVRSAQTWPALNPGEMVVRLRIEVPDDLKPLTHDVTIADSDAGVLAVAESVELPGAA